jgi:asparagine synthase (glutamine-hydrolysing)
MCGILGHIERQEPIDQARFDAQRDRLAHRGPDGAGSWFSPDGCVAFGHRRLSFLDLGETGAQPMPNEDGTLWLTFNGEIYNYRELRQTLQALGHQFRSESDSEVLLHGYETWGTALPTHLKGMFAFGIWDIKTQTLFLARDRFGIKPLYYTYDNEGFSFASELKAFQGSRFPLVVREAAISEFLTYRYVPQPNTIYSNVYKLAPAHYLLYQVGKPPIVKPYWSLADSNRQISTEEAYEHLRPILNRSVNEHLASDVPLGSFLSGGYDSSALAVLLREQGQRPHTFSIGFEGWPKSEHQYAKLVAHALDLPLVTELLDDSGFDLLPTLAHIYDEPLADISIIPTYAVCQLASRFVKGAFSGEGGDEVFAGYIWHRDYSRFASVFSPLQAAYRSLWPSSYAHSKLSASSRYAQYMAMGLFDSATLAQTLTPKYTAATAQDPFWFYRQYERPDLSPIKQMQWLDFHTFLPELVLAKMDRASMAHSLEVRVPLLDHALVEFVLSLATSAYYKPQKTKVLLEPLLRGRVPNAILSRKKQGFTGPTSYYSDLSFYRKYFAQCQLVERGIIRQNAIPDFIARGQYWHLWKLCILENWFRHGQLA